MIWEHRKSRKLRSIAAAIFALMTPAAPTKAEPAQRAKETSLPDGQRYDALVRQGFELVKAGRFQEAISNALDPTIDHFNQQKMPAGRLVYCSHSTAETLFNSLDGIAKKKDSVVFNATWCDALYLKGFALVSLNRLDEGEIWIRKALQLAPMHAQYLNELGHLLTVRKDWTKAKATFAKAEKAALSVEAPDSKSMQSRACRGIGYIQVEEHDLDVAEATYNRCLGIDANDAKARQEIGYVKSLKQHSPKL